MTQLRRLLLATVLIVGSAGTASALPACRDAEIGVLCACRLTKLRPLQGAIGLDQVKGKVDDIKARPVEELIDLISDPIKVVRGPDNNLYITDHHHKARAWLDSGMSGKDSFCEVIGLSPAASSMTQFIAVLRARDLVRLASATGEEITFDKLPQSLADLQDDPYRSMARKLRRKAWCRPSGQVEFAEFRWADLLRKHKAEGLDRDKAERFVRTDAEAKELPGYLGPDIEARCPKDDEAE